MGEPNKLTCRICESEYFLHPASEKPIKDADLCPTCETFQLGMKNFYEVEPEKDRRVLGWLIMGFTAFCTLMFIGWLIFGRR